MGNLPGFISYRVEMECASIGSGGGGESVMHSIGKMTSVVKVGKYPAIVNCVDSE